MFEPITDNVRAALRLAFHCNKSRDAAVSDVDVIRALNSVQRSLAARLLSDANVEVSRLAAGRQVTRAELIQQANIESKRRKARYIGTEHMLLALARSPGSALATVGVTADQLDEMLSAIEQEWHRNHPPVARRLGSAVRTVLTWMRSRR
jgi:ATP-dependent Clp protease ATP-binding subunit ClpA